MKISKLHIDQFRHLENLDFDFTYQSGDRKGQPLDKICFIGQSASGKTGLLSFIYNSIKEASLPPQKNMSLKKTEEHNYLELKNNQDSYIIPNKNNELKPVKTIFFPTDLNTNSLVKIFEKNYSYIFNDINKKKQIERNNEHLIKQQHIIIDANVETIWDFILFELQDYSERLKQLGNKISSETDTNNITKIIENWKENNPNPYTNLAELCLNPILKNLNLELSTTLEKNKLISIKSISKQTPLTTTSLSTGTKQLLITALPLYKFNTKDSIILIDEPERSLYPDMQMDLMDYYKNLAPEAQFIVATHSPFIAASFEPDERFILYFDEDGQVAVRRGSSPIGDDPNDMLKNDFGVNYYNKHGEEAYQKYISLKQEMATETDPKRKKELLLETVKLGDTYNF